MQQAPAPGSSDETTMRVQRRSGHRRVLFFAGVVLLWSAAIAVLATAGLEAYWRTTADRDDAIDEARPRFSALDLAYKPFAVQHLHPLYGFAFPFEPKQREALGNEICSLTPDGFRGPGLEGRGQRLLALVLGGSAAFGHYASSDSTTVTGYLNRLQNEYWFVNAGVPSWNSTQELYRLAVELLDLKPALVIAYNGANDHGLLQDQYLTGGTYPVGSPESFRKLARLVDDIRGSPLRPRGADLLRAALPEVMARLERGHHSDERARPSPMPDSLFHEGVSRYVSNLVRMKQLTNAAGARFVAVFQPVSGLHRRLRPGFKGTVGGDVDLERFHAAVVTRLSGQLEFYDLGNMFDAYFDVVPSMEKGQDVGSETIFIDRVHLFDSGNKLVAQRLVRTLRQSVNGCAAGRCALELR